MKKMWIVIAVIAIILVLFVTYRFITSNNDNYSSRYSAQRTVSESNIQNSQNISTEEPSEVELYSFSIFIDRRIYL